MRYASPALALSALFLPTVLAQDPACTNVTIATPADAERVATACTTVQGDLRLSPDVNETITLDGVQTVSGSILFDGRCEQNCSAIPASHAFKSSTLRAVEGSFSLVAWLGLDAIELPSLQSVGREFKLEAAKNLTKLDLAGLVRVGGFDIEAPLLREFKHTGFYGFNVGNPNITVRAADVESIDSLLRPVPMPLNGTAVNASIFPWVHNITVKIDRLPRVKKYNVGWPTIDTLDINGPIQRRSGRPGDGPGVTLGVEGGNSTMALSNLFLGGIDWLNLHSSLTGGLVNGQRFSLQYSSIEDTFKIPFDNPRDVHIFRNDNLRALELPSSPEFGKRITELYLNGNALEVKSWPAWNPGPIRSIVVQALVHNSAFDAFWKDRNPDTANPSTPTVDQLFISGAASDFNCAPFNKLREKNVITTGQFSCHVSERSGASVPGFSGAALLFSLVLHMLWA